jgi:tetratricopeptide (TPR) repeat protein
VWFTVGKGRILKQLSLFGVNYLWVIPPVNDPGDARAFVNLGLIMARQRKFLAAEQQIQQALILSPNDVRALTTLGMVEGKMDHHQESIEAFRHVVALSPESPDGHLNLGIALADRYDLQGALKEFSEAISLSPSFATVYYSMGRVLYHLDRRDEALHFFDTVCKFQPN